jgi:hypothetical protein
MGTIVSVDDLDGRTVTAEMRASDLYDRMIIILDPDEEALYRKDAAILSAAAARTLGARLIELADAADAADAEASW